VLIRLVRPTSSDPSAIKYPELPAHVTRERNLFAATRPPLRCMTVVIDEDLTTDACGPDQIDARSLLNSLLSHPYIRTIRLMRQAGSFHALLRPESGYAALVVNTEDPDSSGVVGTSEHGTYMAGVMGNAHVLAADDDDSPAYTHLDLAQRADRRREDRRCAGAAEAMHADIYVTSRDYLLSGPRPPVRDTTIATVEQAVGIVSLYLRAQGASTLWINGRSQHVTSRRDFDFRGATAILPSGQRWVVGFNMHVHSVGSDDLINLGASLFTRLSRAIRARDHVHTAINSGGGSSVGEALAHVDTVAVSLMAAFDVAARVAHETLNLQGSRRSASWRRGTWREQVAKQAPDLAALVEPDSVGDHTLGILSALRNTIHERALETIGVRHHHRTLERMQLPPALYGDMIGAIGHLGGAEVWGIEPLGGGMFQAAHPDIVVEQLMGRAITLLDSLLAKTPTERLGGVNMLDLETSVRAAADGYGEPWIPISVRLQLAIG
jgi:hypothetical protein